MNTLQSHKARAGPGGRRALKLQRRKKRIQSAAAVHTCCPGFMQRIHAPGHCPGLMHPQFKVKRTTVQTYAPSMTKDVALTRRPTHNITIVVLVVLIIVQT
jgi:hypothetical protein